MRINVALLCGGRSSEHEVSLISAKNIISALNKDKYNITIIGIDKNGFWHYENKENFLLNENDPKLVSLNKSGKEVIPNVSWGKNEIIFLNDGSITRQRVDVFLPVLHGPFGEDGTIQGLFEMNGTPYVGSPPLGSSIGMDKDISKRLLRDAGIPIAKYLCFNSFQKKTNEINFGEIKKQLGLPFFIKPANLGSSVGISKVNSENEFIKGINEAFKYDLKIIIEESIDGREIEVAVLGNSDPKASLPGEIVTNFDFYSYDAKYISQDGAKLEIPAKLDSLEVKKVQELSIRIFKVLEASCLARVDFFLTKDGDFICNEINTFPGFTKISMYPKLWEATGTKYSDLLDRLIELAIQKSSLKKSLQS